MAGLIIRGKASGEIEASAGLLYQSNLSSIRIIFGE